MPERKPGKPSDLDIDLCKTFEYAEDDDLIEDDGTREFYELEDLLDENDALDAEEEDTLPDLGDDDEDDDLLDDEEDESPDYGT